MDGREYQAKAMRSKSDIHQPRNFFHPQYLLVGLDVAVGVGQLFRLVKKAVFGGVSQDLALGEAALHKRVCSRPISEVTDSAMDRFSQINPDILHGILGLLNESGETAECLHKHLADNSPLDLANLDEEMGDKLWFIACYCQGRGISINDLMEMNLRKLQARYPDKFDPAKLDDAGRDKAAETAAMQNVPCAECHGRVTCDCPCHTRGMTSLHIVACCSICPECGRYCGLTSTSL